MGSPFGDIFDMTNEKLNLLVFLLKSKNIINNNEENWINSINTFNQKIIFSKINDPATAESFLLMMKNNTYKEFEDYCRNIANQEEVAKQKANNEE
jgi:hypothetical protein